MFLSVMDILFDFCMMAVLISISQILRSRLSILQRIYIPAALIAGLMGLFLGKWFLNVLNFSG